MSKMCKQMLSLILAMVMVFSSMPLQALATETEPSSESAPVTEATTEETPESEDGTDVNLTPTESIVDPAQALIDTLPVSVNSQADYDAVYDIVCEIEDNGYDLTGDQLEAVFFTMNAADEWHNADLQAVTYEEPDEAAYGEAAASYDVDAVGRTTVGVNKSNTNKPSSAIPDGSEWVKADSFRGGKVCGKFAHTHSDSCYDKVLSCDHNHVQSCYTNYERCYSIGGTGCTKGHAFHYTTGSGLSYKCYGSKTLSCDHNHDDSCYSVGTELGEGCPTRSWRNGNVLEGDFGGWQYYEHTHSEPDCFQYVWELVWKTYNNLGVVYTGAENTAGITGIVSPETAKHNDQVTVTLTLPAGTDESTTWTATVDGVPQVLTPGVATTFEATVAGENISVKLDTVKVYNVSVRVNTETPWGTASVDTNSGTKGTQVTVTANPNPVSGAYTYFVAKIEVNGVAITGNSFIIEEADADVVVTFGRNELEVNSAPKMEINGYHTTTDYSARFDNIKANILSAVLKNGYTNVNDYNLHIWIDPIAGSERYFNWDDDRAIIGDNFLLTSTNPYRFPCDGFGDSKFATDLKVKIIDNQGRTVEATIAVAEKRKPAVVTPPSALTGTFNTREDFLAELKKVTVAYDNDNKAISADALTLTPTWNGHECLVTWEVTRDGATWLKASDNLGTYIWTASTYNATFNYKDADGNSQTVTHENVAYNTAVEVPAVSGFQTADKVYTFAGWDTDGNTATIELAKDATSATVTAAVTYTAVFTETARKYEVKFYDYDGKQIGETQIVEYGQGAAAPTATQEYKTETLVYTFQGWDEAFDCITGDLTVTAQYDSETRYYSVTFYDEDGETVLQSIDDLEYNEIPAYTNAIPTKPADNTYTYLFDDWDKEIVAVTKDGMSYKATYSPTYIDYTITWIYNGKIDTETYHYGDNLNVPTAVDYVVGNTTYTFQGWDFDGNGKFEVGENEALAVATVTGEITYAAIYTDLTAWDVVVEFGNGDADATGKVEDGKTYTVPADPEREGYRFMGWKANGTEVKSGDVLTITANTTITAQWAELFTVTWINDGKTYLVETDKYIAGQIPQAPADPSKAADAKYTYTFSGWDPAVGAITGDTTYTATYTETVNSYTITFVDENGTKLYEQTLDYGQMPEYKGTTPVKQYYTWAWDKEITSVSGSTTYTLVWTPNTDNNNNGVADEQEMITIKIQYIQYGNGRKGAGTVSINGIRVEGEYFDEIYNNPNGPAFIVDGYREMDMLIDSKNPAAIEIVAAPDVANKNNGFASYVSNIYYLDGDEHVTISSSETGNGVMTAHYTPKAGDVIGVNFHGHELNASNGTIKVNKYYAGKSDKTALATLRTDILTAAGLSTDSTYVVTAQAGFQSINLVGTVEIYDGDAKLVGDAASFDWMIDEDSILAGELKANSWSFTISSNGVSKTVTMKIKDSRPSAGLNDHTVSEVKVLDNEQGLSDYIDSIIYDSTHADIVNPNRLNVTVNLTDGVWPPAKAGVDTKLVYTVKYADDVNYIGDEAKLTVYVQSSFNNCTVIEGCENADNGSIKVNSTPADTEAVLVAGNSTVTVEVTPNSDKVVETITVTNMATGETVAVSAISYSDKKATVTFKTDGSTVADEYIVSVTYSAAGSLDLDDDAVIRYIVGSDDKDGLAKMVFNAMVNANNNMTPAGIVYHKNTVKVTYNALLNLPDWAQSAAALLKWDKKDIESADEAIKVLGKEITHQFGSKGKEEVTITWTDPTGKYGTVTGTADLNVFNANYNATVDVDIKTNGADATIKTQFSAESREYMGVNYFLSGEKLTITLTPDGELLKVLEQLYNGTYSDSMAYIKSVVVTDKAGNVIPAAIVRDQGELSLDNILQGVNPMLYNAAVTFTPAADTQYVVTVEYGILELDRIESSVQMPMYQGGENYIAEVPSAQEIIDKILGKDYADNFLATYGGAFTVEFSTDLISYSWTEVSDEALLALNDGAKVRIRITWKPVDGNKTYYPVAQQADLILVDGRQATSVTGNAPEKQVNFVSEDRLIAELKEAMGLAINVAGEIIDVDFVVTYNLKGNDAEGYFADVTVAYEGSADYKPTSKTFDNVPVANRPNDATIKISIQNASDVVTNNDGKIQTLDPASGIYTVIGNGTYSFKLTPAAGYAIESVTVNGEKLEKLVSGGRAAQLRYENGSAFFSLYLGEKEHYEIVVESVDSIWVLEDQRVYEFATGITKPNNADIVDAATKAPTDIDFEQVKVEYLARAEGKVTVTLPDIDLIFTVLELGTFDIDLGELWLNPEEAVSIVSEAQLDKILEDLVDDVISKVSHGELAATNAFTYIQNYIKNLPLGIHAFGANGDGSSETVRFSYKDNKYLLEEVVTDVTIKDYRIATEIVANDCEVNYGYSLANLISASGAYVSADGSAVSGLKIETKDLYKHANTEAQEITLTFAGDENYQPCKVTINVTVNKANAKVNYDSQIITYGEVYDFGMIVTPVTMPDGTNCNPEMVEFMIGLDAHKLLDLDITSETVGLDQAIGFIQLRLPESIRNLPLVGEYLQGEFTLSEFSNLINSLSDALGIDEGSVDILNQVIEAITGITDRVDIKVIIKDEAFHPKNIGVYVAGAVTVDADFETAYTADYLIIKPKATEVELSWNEPALTNALVTLPMFATMDKGASVVDEDVKDFPVNYLVFGINSDTSEFLSTDINGNIKANIWLNPEEICDNGAYVQIAFGVQWGNEFKYAVPIVRSFAVVPALYNVELVDATGKPNDELLKTFDNEPHGFSVIVTDDNGNVIYDDHNRNAVGLRDNAQLIINYTGIQTNGQVYNSTEKPVHAGVYAATAIYLEFNDGETLDIRNLTAEDLYELFDLVDLGMDAALLVIEPSESSVVVENHTHVFGTPYDLEGLITVDSLNSNVTPDTTVISAMVAATNDVSSNGLAGITGSVNVDFPKWVDELIAEYVPGVQNGMTVAQLKTKLVNNLPDISAKLEQLGASSEVINSLSNLIHSVSSALDQLPGNVKLTFDDEVQAYAVGAYLVMAVVTDSDHYPSVDAGLLIVTPDATEVVLKYEEDPNGNNIFTPEGLKNIDLGAKAYDPVTGMEIEEASALVVNIFVGINAKGEIFITDDQTVLDNGIYTEFSYILDIGGKLYYAEPVSRVIALAPNTVELYFVDANGEKNNDQLFVFDNTAKSMAVEADFNNIVFVPAAEDLTFNYVGIQTNGAAYSSSKAPTHAGIYAVTVSYSAYDENGKLQQFGAAVGAMAIEPTESTIEVTGQTVTYDGKGHTATVMAESSVENLKPDCTLISGGAYVSGDINKIGMDAFHGNVNIDFPRWLDAALAEYEFADGVNAEKLSDYISAYRDELISAVTAEKLVEWNIITEAHINAYHEKLNAYIDALLTVLAKLPKDVSLTFEDSKTYSEPGAYFYYGIVTDPDHYPSTDTGLLVIEKMDLNFGAFHNVVPYDGLEHEIIIPNDIPNEYPVDLSAVDYLTVIMDRDANHINLLLDDDAMFVMNVAEKILGIEIPDSITIAELNAKLAQAGLTLNDFADVMAQALSALLDGMEKPEDPQDYAKSTYRDLFNILTMLNQLPIDGTFTINGKKPVNVGQYEFYVFCYSEYYKTQGASAVLIIEPIRIVIDDVAAGKIYGETDPDLTAMAQFFSYVGREYPFSLDLEIPDGFKRGDRYLPDGTDIRSNFNAIAYKEVELNALPENVLSYTVTRAAGEHVGEYELYINGTLTDSKNYILEVIEDDVFTITKGEVSIILDSQTKVYGETDPELTYTVSGLVNGDTAEDLNVVVTREAGENVGEFVISATAENDNYKINVVDSALTITKATVEIKIDNKAKVYGETDPALTYSATGLVGSDDLGIMLSREEGENVGDYKITASWTENSNYMVVENVGVLTITKAIVGVSVNDATKIYGEADPSFTAEIVGMKNGEILNFSFTREEGENVGKYLITAAVAENSVAGNYNIVFTTGSLTVSPALLTISVKDGAKKVYGETDPVFAAELDGLKFNDNLDVKFTREEGEDVGEYIITTVVTEDCVAAGNYDITYVTGILTIIPAKATVFVDNKTKVYGEADPELTYTATGLIGSDRLAVTVSRAEGEDVGTYAITAAVAVNGNYDVTVENGTFTITAKQITAADVELNGTLTYNGTEQTQAIIVTEGITYVVTGNTGINAGEYTLTVTGTGNYTGSVELPWNIQAADAVVSKAPSANVLTYTGAAQVLVNAGETSDGKLVYSLSEDGEFTEAVPTGLNAGDYTVWYYVVGDANHTDSVKASVNVTVAKAELTITAKNNGITYGDIPVANGVIGNGFVSGEDLDDLAGELAYSFNYEQYGNVGSYKITPSGLTSGNYEITFVDGALTVIPKSIAVKAEPKSKTYGEADPGLTYAVSGLVNNDQLSGALVRAEGESVGIYAIEQGTLTAGNNYVITYTGADLTINAKAITDADVKLDGTLTYNGTEQTQAILVTEGITYEVTGNNGTNAGEYTLTVTGTGNYVGSVELSWSIAEAKATVTANDASKIYGETDPELTYTATGLIGSDKLDVTVSREKGEDVGTYAISVTVAENSNYDVTVKNGTFTITAKENDKVGLYPIGFNPEKDTTGTIAPGAIVEIDGMPYVLDENCVAWIDHTNAKIVTTYKYHVGSNAHETYPTNMYVWYLTIVDKDSDGDCDAYTAERIEELDDFFKYEGTSIRINFNSNGIRFFTSVDAEKCADLINGTLLSGKMEGYKMIQTGTLYKKFTGTDSVITFETGLSSDVFGGKAGDDFRVFSTVGNRNWFTGMLTGLEDDAASLDMDIQSRPFAMLELNGETVVLYGGTVQRSIYYVATQNRDYWAPGTVYDNYVENLIAIVEKARKES